MVIYRLSARKLEQPHALAGSRQNVLVTPHVKSPSSPLLLDGRELALRPERRTVFDQDDGDRHHDEGDASYDRQGKLKIS
jgi:hypothetical protein